MIISLGYFILFWKATQISVACVCCLTFHSFLLLDSKQKLQDFLSIKVKELNELSERESLLAENLATVCADVENDLSAQNEQVSHQLTLLKSQNNSLNVEVADRKHGTTCYFSVWESNLALMSSLGNETQTRRKQAKNSRTCS